jgi:hypothetical protein
MNPFAVYTLVSGLITIILSGLTVLLPFFGVVALPDYTPVVPVYFFLAGMAAFRFLGKSPGKSAAKQISRYMVLSTVRLLLHLGVLIILVFSDQKNAVPLLIVFLTSYIVYTVWEVYWQLRHNNGAGSQTNKPVNSN